MKITSSISSKPLIFEYLPKETPIYRGGGKYRVLEAIKKIQPCIRPQIQKEANLSQSRTMHWLRILVKEGLVKRRMAIIRLEKTTTTAPVYVTSERKK